MLTECKISSILNQRYSEFSRHPYPWLSGYRMGGCMGASTEVETGDIWLCVVIRVFTTNRTNSVLFEDLCKCRDNITHISTHWWICRLEFSWVSGSIGGSRLDHCAMSLMLLWQWIKMRFNSESKIYCNPCRDTCNPWVGLVIQWLGCR